MPTKNVSDQTGVTDFKKLYSSHVQENKFLQRRKSFIDEEKLRTFKNLTFEESAFLRKYDKYTTRAYSDKHRHSIDASLLRTADSNAQKNCVSRLSLGRDAVHNDFPYSFETWHKMVDTDSDIIECHKSEILSAYDGDVHLISEGYTNTITQLSEAVKASTKDWQELKNESLSNSEKISEIEIVSDANSIADETIDLSNMLRRRHSLTPIDKSLLSKSTENLAENEKTFDEEKLSPRSVVKNRYRRHSTTPVLPPPGLQRRRQTVDIGSMRLPSIIETLKREKTQKEIQSRKSKSDNDLLSLSTQKVTSIPANKQKAHGVTKLKVNDIDADQVPHDLSSSPRPTPNAAVFVCGDSGVSERKDVTDHKRDINQSPEKQDDKAEGFLPDINESQTLIQTPTHDYLDTPPMRGRSLSVSRDSPALSTDNIRASRRASMGTTALNLLVENTKGAARLRYIALLATEMEREEKQRLNIVSPPSSIAPTPEELMKSVKDCRYLRVYDPNAFERADTIL